MKRYLLSGLFLLFMLVPFRAANKTDLSNELESALKQRNQYSLQKETRIDSLNICYIRQWIKMNASDYTMPFMKSTIHIVSIRPCSM